MGLAVNLTWTADPAARSYLVHRGSTAAFTPSSATVLRRVSQPRFVDDAATAGKTLFYRIVAVDAAGLSSAPSNVASVSSPDGMAAHRSKAATWLSGQQEQSQGFRMTFDANYQGSNYVGPISGHIADIDQLPRTLTKNPWISFTQNYPASYTGPVNGRWANVTSPERYEVRVYAHPEGDIEYRQGTQGFALNADGTWSSGAVSVNLGAKIARVVLRGAVEPAWPQRVAYVAASDSNLPAESLDAVEVQVFYRTDIDYLQDTVALSPDGTWITRFPRPTNGAFVIARLVKKSTKRTISSTEWAADTSYQGLVRSFTIPFDDPAYGYEGDATQRTGYRLEQRSWMYDDAVAVLAFLSNDQPERARAVLANLSQVQQPDGSLPFSADVYRGQIYEVYVRTGALAWVATAALAYEQRTGDPAFRYLAQRTADYLLTLQVSDPADPKYGAIRGGWGRYDENYDFIEGYVGFAGTEHNIDSYFVLRDIGYTTGEQRYLDAAERVKQALLTKFWNPTEKRFNQGIDDPAKALDAGSWGGLFLSAIGREDMARDSLAFSEQFRVEDATIEKCSQAECYNQTYSSAGPIDGYRPYLETTGNYAGAPATVWAEGTWGQLLLRLRLGQDITADLQSMQRLQDADPRGGYLQVTRGAASLPYEFHAWPAVGGTGWAAMVMSDPSFFWMPDKWVDERPAGVGPTGPVGPTEPGETTGGNPAQNCTQSCAADPINTATGEFFLGATDLSVIGRGLPLSAARTYSTNRAAQDGRFGYGWNDNLNIGLRINTNATNATNTANPANPGAGTAATLASASLVDVIQETGAVLTFARDGRGGFIAPRRTLASLTRNSDGTYTFIRRQQTTMKFSAEGRLISITDPHANTITPSYDTAGVLQKVTAASGRTFTFTYTGTRITKVSDAAGRGVSYAYSSAGDLTSVTAADGAITSYAYDSAHRLTSMTSPAGLVTTNTYDSSGRVTQQTQTVSATQTRATTFAYSTAGGTGTGGTGTAGGTGGAVSDGSTTITDANGIKTVETYTDAMLSAKTVAAGTAVEATWRYTYTAALNLATVTDPLGRITSSADDVNGNVIRRSDPSGKTTSYTYDALANLTSSTDAAGKTTTLTYDATSNPLTSTDPTGAVTTNTYNPDGTLATSTEALGAKTTFAYTGAGDLAQVSAPTGAVTAYAYDGAGRMTGTTSPTGRVSTTTLMLPAGR